MKELTAILDGEKTNAKPTAEDKSAAKPSGFAAWLAAHKTPLIVGGLGAALVGALILVARGRK